MLYLVAATAALLQPGFVQQRSPVCPRRASAAQMVSAQEVFGQYYEASPPAQKTLQSLPTAAAKGAMAGLVGVTAAGGFLLTPSRRIPVQIVGGALASIGGNAARKKVAVERQKAAVPALAALLAEGLPKVTPEALGNVASEYDVPKKQFETQCAEMYLTFINACLASQDVQTSELSELLRLQALLKLTPAQIGTQIYAAARQLYSRHRAYLEDDEMNDSKRLLAKFVFLAERILSRDESPEGYRYESLRLQKLFSLTTMDWRSMAEDTAMPFYEKALTSAVIDNKPASSAQLQAVRQSLGINDATAAGTHADYYGKAAQAMIESGAFSAADKERLTVVQDLLGMDGDDTGKTLQALTTPLYASSFASTIGALEGLSGDADDAMCAQQSGALAMRMGELLLDADAAHALEINALRARATEMLANAVKLLRAQNMRDGLAEVQKLEGFAERATKFMVQIEHIGGPADGAIATLFGGIKGKAKQSEILSAYRVLLSNYLEDQKIDEAEAASLSRMRAILALSELEANSVYAAAAGPIFRAAVGASVSSGTYDKAALEATLANLALPTEVTSEISSEVYGEKLKTCVESKADGIIDEAQSAELASLRDYLGLAMEDVHEVHDELCAPAYSASVKQVMGTSGIIPDAYWEGLSKLRERLGLGEEGAQALFAVEVTAKMKEFGEKAIAAMTSKMEKQQKQQQEGAKGDMAMDAGSVSVDVLNLVDFALAAKAIVVKEAAGKEFEVCGANLKGAFDDREIKQLYREYLIEAFQGSDAAQNQKLFDNLTRLALVLGLQSNEVQNIHNEIGSFIIRNYITKALKTGPLGAEATQFLVSIKDALGMEQSKCDELVKDCKLNRVSILIEGMFEKSQVVADDVRMIRDAADDYEIDLVDDLQISQFKLERMFLCELEDLVDTGELKADDMGPLIELCEPLNISEESATKMLEDTVQKRVGGGVLEAASSLRQANKPDAITKIGRALKYAALLPDIVADAKAVGAGEKQELFLLYQASQQTAGKATDESTAQLELLRSVLALASPAAA